MTIWNLRDFSELETPVMGRFERPQSRSAARKGRITSLQARFKVTAGIAIAGVSLLLAMPTVSSAGLIAPVAGPIATAQSIRPTAPPLFSLYGDMFGKDWTAEAEETALAALAKTHSSAQARYGEEEFLDVALPNQQESFSTDAPALTREQAREIIRKKRRFA